MRSRLLSHVVLLMPPGPFNLPSGFNSIGKQLSVKVHLAIYCLVLVVSGYIVHQCVYLVLDFSSCVYMVGFPKHIHIRIGLSRILVF